MGKLLFFGRMYLSPKNILFMIRFFIYYLHYGISHRARWLAYIAGVIRHTWSLDAEKTSGGMAKLGVGVFTFARADSLGMVMSRDFYNLSSDMLCT